MNEEGKYWAYVIGRRRFRCPRCNEVEVRYVTHTEFVKNLKRNLPVEKLPTNKYYCFNCKASFKDIKKLALVDGIFLDKNSDMRVRSKRYVEEICKKLKLSDDVQEKAIEILEEYDKSWGRRAVSAASIYTSALMCGEPRTQIEIADAANIRDVALRKWYKDIKATLNLKIFASDY